MGRAKARPGAGRRSGATRRQGKSGRKALWAAGAVAVVAVGVLATRNAGAAHPEPRQMDHAGHVVHHAQYRAQPRVAEIYRQAAAVPAVLDGIYCYCACSRHSGHHSLLDCFASDHAARCDICLSEAALAHRMTRDGKSLREIRDAIDAIY